jgi:hypothetical protein
MRGTKRASKRAIQLFYSPLVDLEAPHDLNIADRLPFPFEDGRKAQHHDQHKIVPVRRAAPHEGVHQRRRIGGGNKKPAQQKDGQKSYDHHDPGRGREYGRSHIICAVHYPSDVIGGELMVAAVVGKFHAMPEFRRDLGCAQQERAVALKARDQMSLECLLLKSQLVLLCYKNSRWQQGHRGRQRAK